MKSSEPCSKAKQTDSVAVPQKREGAGCGMPKNRHRSLRQPPTQNGTSLSAEQIASLSRFAAVLQAAMPAASPPVPQQNGAGPDGPALGRTLTHEEAALLTRAMLNETYRRVPKGADTELNRPAEVCPHTGLNRNQFYELFDLRENGRPVIKNFSLKQKGEKSGARFYSVGSVLDYLDRLAEIQAQAEAAKT